MVHTYYEQEPLLWVCVFGDATLKLIVHLFKLEHDVHLLAIGLELQYSIGDHKCQCLGVRRHIAIEFCPDLNVNDGLF